MTGAGGVERAAAAEAEHVIAKAVERAGVRDAEQPVEGELARAAAGGARSTAERQLLDELAANGIKHSPADVVAVARDSQGRVIFLETGNARAGLTHILEQHEDDFARKGVSREDIPDLVMRAATEGRQVGVQGTPPGVRPVYEVTHEGRPLRIAVTVGRNGFVVGANPR